MAEDLKNALNETAYYYSSKLTWVTSAKKYNINGRPESSGLLNSNQKRENRVNLTGTNLTPLGKNTTRINNNTAIRGGKNRIDKTENRNQYSGIKGKENRTRAQKSSEGLADIRVLKEILNRLARIEECYAKGEQAQPAPRS